MSNPWLSLAISDAILAFSSLFGVFALFHCRKMVEEKLPITAALLAYLLIGAAAFLGTLRYGFSASWAPANKMMTAAALTLSPSLLASALWVTCFKKVWERVAWWRLLIGLMAGYELSRQLGWVYEYNTTVNTFALGVMAVTAIHRFKMHRMYSAFMLIAIAAYALASLVVGMEGQMGGYLRLDLYHYLLALGHLFSASGIFILVKKLSRR